MRQKTNTTLRVFLSLVIVSVMVTTSLMITHTAKSQSRNEAVEDTSVLPLAPVVSVPGQSDGIPVPPQYQIFDIGIVQTGDTASQGFGASTDGVAVGRSIRTGASQAFTWTLGGGIVGLPNLAGRPFAVSNAANDSGPRDVSNLTLWTCSTTADE